MNRKDVIMGLGAAATLAVFSFLASSSPDGLERVAEDKKFMENSKTVLNAPIPDYVFPGIHNEKLAGSAAGVAGVVIMFSLGVGLSGVLKEK